MAAIMSALRVGRGFGTESQFTMTVRSRLFSAASAFARVEVQSSAIRTTGQLSLVGADAAMTVDPATLTA